MGRERALRELRQGAAEEERQKEGRVLWPVGGRTEWGALWPGPPPWSAGGQQTDRGGLQSAGVCGQGGPGRGGRGARSDH